MILQSDPIRCAEAVIDRVGRELVVAVPIGIGKPVRLLNALYELAAADKSLRLRIFTGLTLVRPRYKSDLERRFVAPLLNRLFPTWPDLEYAEALRSGRLPSNIEIHEFFLQAGQWLSTAAVQQSYASINYRHVAEHLRSLGTNVLAQAVSPHPTGANRVSLSSNTDITLDMRSYIDERRASGAPIAVVGEINAKLPYMLGEADVDAAEFDQLLAPAGPAYDLFAPPKEPVPLADYAMALHVAPWIADGGTLQIGIGSFADALCHVLILRQTRNEEFRELVSALGNPLPTSAELEPFRIGLYGCSEMLVDGFVALARAGILKRAVPDRVTGTPGPLLHAGFFVGNNVFYKTLREMPDDERARFAMTAISFTNALTVDAAAKQQQRPAARFVNTALTATLLGAVAADQLEDGRVISGVGGQCDFAELAHDLSGARGITGVRATRDAGRGRRQSNIVWTHANTTIPRQLRDVIVTEYGAADIRGRSDAEVAAAMIAISDAVFAPGLKSSAMAAGKLPKSYFLPDAVAGNTPQRIVKALGPARASGLLPKFPLGSDMTAVEETLLPALAHMRSADIGELARSLFSGFTDTDRAGDARKIERMALTSPKSWREHLMRALLRGAIHRAKAD